MFRLTYLDRYDIEDKDAGLTEPSGLALAKSGRALWTVGDESKRIFQISLDGRLRGKKTIKVSKKGLEGITNSPSDTELIAVREKNNVIYRLDTDEKRVTGKTRLSDLRGYDTIAHFFGDGEENKGLEGITWDSHAHVFYLLKEGEPGLLIEVDRGIRTIMSATRLSAANGFSDPGLDDKKVDFTDICYIPRYRLLLIVSDKAKRLYLYDRQNDRVVDHAPLGYGKDGKYREIEQAEGVAFDDRSNRLYVVSDKESRLYVYDVGM